MTKNMALLGACLALLVSVSSAAVSHTVGDSTGWTQPSSPSFYPAWASKESVFNVGDFLVFNFMGGAQTVAEVTKSAYDSCSAMTPISQMNNGPVNVTLTSPGTHYYISTDSGHCQAGQKFLITVLDTSTPAGAKTPAASPPMSTPTGKGAITPAAPTPMSTPTGKGAMTPASPTPMSTPTGKGAITPAAPTPMSSPTGKGAMSPSRAMTPGTTPISAPAMTPMSSPMAAPASPEMSPADSPSSIMSSSPATSPSADGGMMTPAGSPMSGGPAAASSSDGGMMTPAREPTSPSNSASVAGAAALILPMLLVVATSFLF